MHRVVVIASCALLVALVDRSASAQQYPSRAVRIVVPFAVGAPDAVARLLSQRISAQLGQPVVVDNRPGANGIIGTQLVATSAPDGYTLLLVSASVAVNPSVQKRLPYDPVRDLAPITAIGATEALILGVNPSLPASSVQELIAFARKPDSRLSFGSPGVGNTTHLAGELFKARTGIEMVHVPYKGAGPAIAALMSGEIQVMFLTPPLSLPHIRAGKLRALGYTHASRAVFLRDVPTMREAGISGMEIDGGWYGLFAPAGTPRAVVDRLNAETRKALADPAVRERLAALGLEPVGNSPEEFRKFFDEQIKAYAAMVRIAGIRPE